MCVCARGVLYTIYVAVSGFGVPVFVCKSDGHHGKLVGGCGHFASEFFSVCCVASVKLDRVAKHTRPSISHIFALFRWAPDATRFAWGAFSASGERAILCIIHFSSTIYGNNIITSGRIQNDHMWKWRATT